MAKTSNRKAGSKTVMTARAHAVRKMGASKRHNAATLSVPNVIYVGHLPKGCEERELIAFLKQFGRLVQLRLCRSHKTGGSKGYAFAKFQSEEVAAIVAETLNGHLLFQKRLISHVLSPEQIHDKLFSKNTKTVFQRKAAPTSLPANTAMTTTTKNAKELAQRLAEREQKKRSQLKALGIEYDFPGYEALLAARKSDPMLEARDEEAAKEKAAAKEEEMDNNKLEESKAPKKKSKRKRSLSGDDSEKKTVKERDVAEKAEVVSDKGEDGSAAKKQRKVAGSSKKKDIAVKKVQDTPRKTKKSADAKTEGVPMEDEASSDVQKQPQSEKKRKKKRKKEKKSRKSFP